MIEAVLQLMGELLLQLFGQLLLELGMHALAEPLRSDPNPWMLALGYTLIGALLGGLSLMTWPQLLTPPGVWRVLNLVLTPLAVGLAMTAVGRWRAQRGQALFAIDRFACGYLFALALGLVRFSFAA